MPVEPQDLGLAMCRVVMRDLDDRPAVIAGPLDMPWEETVAASRCVASQWTAVLTPNPDRVSVSARLRCMGFGLWEQAVLSPGAGQFDKLIFVLYPQDPAKITGAEYEARLREAVEKAVTVVEEDYARVRAAHAAKTGKGTRDAG